MFLEKLGVGPAFNNQVGFGFEGQSLPEFFGDKRHKRVQEFERVCQNKNQDFFGGFGFWPAFGLANLIFGGFNIDIAKFVPEKFIEIADCRAKSILVDVFFR